MAKWLRNEFDKTLNYNNLMKAHNLSKKGKGYKKDIILFELKKEEYIRYLYESLKDGTYRHGGYKVFYVYEPKLRKIEKSKYIDRIVHRFYVDNFLKPYFQTQFIYNSYACIENRGMHKATLDLQKAMKHCKNIWNDYYILKMDVRKFFDNINKDILYKIIERKIKEEKVLWLTKQIIYSSNRKVGMEIGNYTSQVYANIYLNEVDQYAKHILKCKYYYRYLDDTVILLKTKEEAKIVLEKIKSFLKEKLELELNEKTQIFKSKQGVNFCGYKINEYRLKIRDKGKRKLKKKIKYLKYKIKNEEFTSKDAQKYLAGHKGYLQIADVNNLTDKLFYKE